MKKSTASHSSKNNRPGHIKSDSEKEPELINKISPRREESTTTTSKNPSTNNVTATNTSSNIQSTSTTTASTTAPHSKPATNTATIPKASSKQSNSSAAAAIAQQNRMNLQEIVTMLSRPVLYIINFEQSQSSQSEGQSAQHHSPPPLHAENGEIIVQEHEIPKYIETCIESGLRSIEVSAMKDAVQSFRNAEVLIDTYMQQDGIVSTDLMLTVVINLGICFYKVGLFDEAYSCFENSDMRLKKKIGQSPCSSMTTQQKSQDDTISGLASASVSAVGGGISYSGNNTIQYEKQQQSRCSPQKDSQQSQHFESADCSFSERFARRMKRKKLRLSLNLQMCILFSEIGKHEDAVEYAKNAAKIAIQNILDALQVCLAIIIQYNLNNFEHVNATLAFLSENLKQEEGGKNNRSNLNVRDFLREMFEEKTASCDNSWKSQQQQQMQSALSHQNGNTSQTIDLAFKCLPVLTYVCSNFTRLRGDFDEKLLRKFENIQELQGIYEAIIATAAPTNPQIRASITTSQFPPISGTVQTEGSTTNNNRGMPLAQLVAPSAVDMYFMNSSVKDDHWLLTSNILNLLQMKPVTLAAIQATPRIAGQVSVDVALKSIAHAAITFYCISTETRFIDEAKEFWLGKSLEIAYTLLPQDALMISQIVNVFTRFHCVEKQIIPEDEVFPDQIKYLKPQKGVNITVPKNNYYLFQQQNDYPLSEINQVSQGQSLEEAYESKITSLKNIVISSSTTATTSSNNNIIMNTISTAINTTTSNQTVNPTIQSKDVLPSTTISQQQQQQKKQQSRQIFKEKEDLISLEIDDSDAEEEQTAEFNPTIKLVNSYEFTATTGIVPAHSLEPSLISSKISSNSESKADFSGSSNAAVSQQFSLSKNLANSLIIKSSENQTVPASNNNNSNMQITNSASTTNQKATTVQFPQSASAQPLKAPIPSGNTTGTQLTTSSSAATAQSLSQKLVDLKLEEQYLNQQKYQQSSFLGEQKIRSLSREQRVSSTATATAAGAPSIAVAQRDQQKEILDKIEALVKRQRPQSSSSHSASTTNSTQQQAPMRNSKAKKQHLQLQQQTTSVGVCLTEPSTSTSSQSNYNNQMNNRPAAAASALSFHSSESATMQGTTAGTIAYNGRSHSRTVYQSPPSHVNNNSAAAVNPQQAQPSAIHQITYNNNNNNKHSRRTSVNTAQIISKNELNATTSPNSAAATAASHNFLKSFNQFVKQNNSNHTVNNSRVTAEKWHQQLQQQQQQIPNQPSAGAAANSSASSYSSIFEMQNINRRAMNQNFFEAHRTSLAATTTTTTNGSAVPFVSIPAKNESTNASIRPMSSSSHSTTHAHTLATTTPINIINNSSTTTQQQKQFNFEQIIPMRSPATGVSGMTSPLHSQHFPLHINENTMPIPRKQSESSNQSHMLLCHSFTQAIDPQTNMRELKGTLSQATATTAAIHTIGSVNGNRLNSAEKRVRSSNSSHANKRNLSLSNNIGIFPAMNMAGGNTTPVVQVLHRNLSEQSEKNYLKQLELNSLEVQSLSTTTTSAKTPQRPAFSACNKSTASTAVSTNMHPNSRNPPIQSQAAFVNYLANINANTQTSTKANNQSNTQTQQQIQQQQQQIKQQQQSQQFANYLGSSSNDENSRVNSKPQSRSLVKRKPAGGQSQNNNNNNNNHHTSATQQARANFERLTLSNNNPKANGISITSVSSPTNNHFNGFNPQPSRQQQQQQQQQLSQQQQQYFQKLNFISPQSNSSSASVAQVWAMNSDSASQQQMKLESVQRKRRVKTEHFDFVDEGRIRSSLERPINNQNAFSTVTRLNTLM